MTHKRRYKKGDSMIYLNDPSLEGTQNIPIDNKDVMDCLAGQFGVPAPSFACNESSCSDLTL